MPELPEVEAARRAIEEHCIGKKIAKAIVANDNKVIDKVSPSDFENALIGKTLISANRKGKNLWIQLDSPPFPSFQFGMAGAVYIKGVAVTKYKRSAVKDSDEWPSKYSKVFIQLDDGLEFSFTDKRRFAKVRLLDDPTSVPPISELGPDALLEPMSVDELHKSLSKKKIGIKALLLEQSFISGIGNWIADEVLYQARIHPLQSASTLSKESCTTLLKCIKEVIEKALEVGADSSQFPKNWIFHSREKKPGKAFVDGKKIDFITAGGRTTAYVPELQKLDGKQTVKAKKETEQAKEGNDDNDEDEASEEKPSKSKRDVKPGGRSRKTTKKRKSTSSDDDKDGDEEDEAPKEEKVKPSKSKREVKPRGRGERPPSNSSNDDNEDGNNDDASNDELDNDEPDNDEPKKQRGRVKNNKRAETGVTTSKKTVSGRNAGNAKKKVK